jgi:hypothetical protein
MSAIVLEMPEQLEELVRNIIGLNTIKKGYRIGITMIELDAKRDLIMKNSIISTYIDLFDKPLTQQCTLVSCECPGAAETSSKSTVWFDLYYCGVMRIVVVKPCKCESSTELFHFWR